MRPPTLRAVTSPADPVNSENAMDGSAFILLHFAAATESNANILNNFELFKIKGE